MRSCGKCVKLVIFHEREGLRRRSRAGFGVLLMQVEEMAEGGPPAINAEPAKLPPLTP